MNIRSRAHRILKSLSNYKDLSQAAGTVELNRLDLENDEELIGLYENIPGSLERAIIVTDLGLHIQQRKKWGFINYNEIRSSSVPSENKYKADNILITLNDGREEVVSVEGGQGRFRDVFEFLRFLDRVTEDRSLP